jgi:hypothetical protein
MLSDMLRESEENPNSSAPKILFDGDCIPFFDSTFIEKHDYLYSKFFLGP